MGESRFVSGAKNLVKMFAHMGAVPVPNSSEGPPIGVSHCKRKPLSNSGVPGYNVRLLVSYLL